MNLAPYRERMVQAILDLHYRRALECFPNGHENTALVSAETESYRPLAEADVDAIIDGVDGMGELIWVGNILLPRGLVFAVLGVIVLAVIVGCATLGTWLGK